MADSLTNDKSPSKSEGVLSLTVYNVTKFNGVSLSNPVFIRGLDWRIMVTLKKNALGKCTTLGFFIQCGGDPESSAWSCYAKAELVLLSRNPTVPHLAKKIGHLFHESENDWGFGNFKLWSEIIDPSFGFQTNDSITMEAHVEADIPHGVNWDSKKLTGYVGLRNQGATCYMNSLLQTLFFTNMFRKAVYQIPYKGMETVAFALQRVFYGLQFSDRSVDTRILTNSFGWKTSDTLRQQDVHEFLRLLIDKLESTIDHTPMKGTLSNLFQGEMISTIACRYVDYKSSKTETFYDIQLNVIGKSNILQSLDDYVAPEVLDGDNKYDAGIHGLQAAEKRVVFSRFPPVLHLHLLRFHYDPIRDISVKCNARVEFPEQLNLNGYMLPPDSGNVVYSLHSVLVHSGNNRDGHYVVYINPDLKGDWYIFDDDVVCMCSKKEAIDGNFGGDACPTDRTDDGLRRHFRNAYMLVYIQESESNTILPTVSQNDIPMDLLTKLVNKIKLDDFFSKDSSDYTTVQVVLEDSFTSHEGKSLFDPKTVHYLRFTMSKTAVLKDFVDGLSELFKYPKDQIRVWPMNENNHPFFLNTENRSVRLQVRNTNGFKNPWMIFLEMLQPDLDESVLPVFDPKKHVLVFFKFQLPRTKRIIYCGHHYIAQPSSPSVILKVFNEKSGYPIHTLWKIYVEVNRDLVETKVGKKISLQNGDILVFQKFDERSENENLTNEFFEEFHFPIDITLSDLSDPKFSTSVMKSYSNISYEDFIQQLSNKLNTEPNRLQLFLPNNLTGAPGNMLQSYNFNLKTIFQASGEPRTMKIFYKTLSLFAQSQSKLPTKRLKECSYSKDTGEKMDDNP